MQDKAALITGGTGSFGKAMAAALLDTDIREIRILSRDEKKQDDMRRAFDDDRLKFFIGSVRDSKSVETAINGSDFVFHAAALKQVPSCEFFPLEAVQTNINGTDNVLREAKRSSVRKVVVLSTDKAVYPVNAMGMSKGLMEKVMLNHSRDSQKHGTVICCTRYGNVIASRGSVVPLFIEQILQGKPLTVTDPEMTRFVLTLESAVQLVFHALEHGESGDIFIKKAPSTTISLLAHTLLEIFDVEDHIEIIGTRHGEKKHETLMTREERAHSEDMGSFVRIIADSRDLNYKRYFSSGEEQLSELEDYSSFNTERLDKASLKELLLKQPFVQKALEQWQYDKNLKIGRDH